VIYKSSYITIVISTE